MATFQIEFFLHFITTKSQHYEETTRKLNERNLFHFVWNRMEEGQSVFRYLIEKIEIMGLFNLVTSTPAFR